MPNFTLEVTPEERFTLERLVTGLVTHMAESGRCTEDPERFMVLTGLMFKLKGTEKEEVRIETPNSNTREQDS